LDSIKVRREKWKNKKCIYGAGNVSMLTLRISGLRIYLNVLTKDVPEVKPTLWTGESFWWTIMIIRANQMRELLTLGIGLRCDSDR